VDTDLTFNWNSCQKWQEAACSFSKGFFANPGIMSTNRMQRLQSSKAMGKLESFLFSAAESLIISI
jgi:hypothetical protein